MARLTFAWNCSILSLQVCVALRYYATGSMQNLVGDSIQIHKSTVCRVIHRVSLALCHHMKNDICMPSINGQNTNRQKFHAIAGFPDVTGCIDGTQIYNPKSEKVGTVWKTQIKKESSDF